MPSIFRHKPDPLEIRQQNSGYGAIRVWLPTFLAIGIIALESTPTFGANETSGWLRPILENIFGRIPDASWFEFHHILRKTGHFLGYGLVCLAFVRSWLLVIAGQVDLGRTSWRIRSSIAAVLSTAGIASLDELHQTMLPNRTGTPWDVLLDSCGALLTIAILWLTIWRPRASRRRRRS